MADECFMNLFFFIFINPRRQYSFQANLTKRHFKWFSTIMGSVLVLAIILTILFDVGVFKVCHKDADCSDPMKTFCVSGTCRRGKVLLLGGWVERDFASASVAMVGDGCTDNTEELPVPSNGGAAAVLDGSIYYCGGMNGSTTFDQCYIRGQSGEWSTGPKMIAARDFHSLNTVGNTLVIVGGGNGSSTDPPYISTTVEVLNLVSNTWNLQNYTLDIARDTHCAVTISNNTLMLVGGKFSITTELITIETGLVTSYSDLPYNVTNLYGPGCTLHNGHIVLTGGYADISHQDGVFTLDLSDNGNPWIFAGKLEVARSFHTMEILNGVLTVFGGYNDESYLSSVEYNSSGSGWSENPSEQLLVPRSAHASVVIPC